MMNEMTTKYVLIFLWIKNDVIIKNLKKISESKGSLNKYKHLHVVTKNYKKLFCLHLYKNTY